ncbi:hypothetical protein llap_9290 [Limosa lapponica baueri]|uniref:Uncharacterized protein n=1 Tax=Limosa lapponica baueri TaxID=1758121 RepID=A0A2I0U2U9_LIMLA|nr:hypothetical protein llap_9290 [Limosa lapponica baueri]
MSVAVGGQMLGQVNLWSDKAGLFLRCYEKKKREKKKEKKREKKRPEKKKEKENVLREVKKKKKGKERRIAPKKVSSLLILCHGQHLCVRVCFRQRRAKGLPGATPDPHQPLNSLLHTEFHHLPKRSFPCLYFFMEQTTCGLG